MQFTIKILTSRLPALPRTSSLPTLLNQTLTQFPRSKELSASSPTLSTLSQTRKFSTESKILLPKDAEIEDIAGYVLLARVLPSKFWSLDTKEEDKKRMLNGASSLFLPGIGGLYTDNEIALLKVAKSENPINFGNSFSKSEQPLAIPFVPASIIALLYNLYSMSFDTESFQGFNNHDNSSLIIIPNIIDLDRARKLQQSFPDVFSNEIILNENGLLCTIDEKGNAKMMEIPDYIITSKTKKEDLYNAALADVRSKVEEIKNQDSYPTICLFDRAIYAILGQDRETLKTNPQNTQIYHCVVKLLSDIGVTEPKTEILKTQKSEIPNSSIETTQYCEALLSQIASSRGGDGYDTQFFE